MNEENSNTAAHGVVGEQGDHKQIDKHFGASIANKTGWLVKLMNHGPEYVFNLTDPFGLNNAGFWGRGPRLHHVQVKSYSDAKQKKTSIIIQ